MRYASPSLLYNFYYNFQALVIVLTLATVGVGTYGVLHIELNYDSIWYMDQNSYQTDYYKTLMEVFPEHGERVEVYVGKSSQLIYTKLKILDLYTILTSQK
jgi:hypothetical protein